MNPTINPDGASVKGCAYCNGTGWIEIRKPAMSNLDGHMLWITVPQPCFACDAYSQPHAEKEAKR